MGKPPIIYPQSDGEPVPHTERNWRDGHIAHDLSNDLALAEAGDEEAKERLETQRLLAMKQMARQSDEK